MYFFYTAVMTIYKNEIQISLEVLWKGTLNRGIIIFVRNKHMCFFWF